MRLTPTLVCFAVKEEAKTFMELSAKQENLHIRVTGMGRRNAERSLCVLLAEVNPALVLTCGLAGGLNPRLATGTVVFDADEANPLCSTLLQAGAEPARFHCADHVASTVAEKQALRQATGADAVEMESQIIRDICRQRGISAATVRVILDPAGEDLPLDFNRLLGADGRVQIPKLAMALLRSPGKVRALLGLQKQTQAAARRLAECLIRVLS